MPLLHHITSQSRKHVLFETFAACSAASEDVVGAQLGQDVQAGDADDDLVHAERDRIRDNLALLR